LLVQKESGIYGFIHLTFQEYMASVHIKEERLLTELISRVNQTWWHETARLYSAQTDASPIAYGSWFYLLHSARAKRKLYRMGQKFRLFTAISDPKRWVSPSVSTADGVQTRLDELSLNMAGHF